MAWEGHGGSLDADVLAASIAARRFQAAVWGVVISLARPEGRRRLEERLEWFRRGAAER